MTPQIDDFESARGFVKRFLDNYEPTEKELRGLAVLDPSFAQLNRSSWKASIEGETSPHPRSATRTIKLARWLTTSLDDVLNLMPNCKRRHIEILSLPVLSRQHIDGKSRNEPQNPAQKWIDLAGSGHPQAGFKILLTEFSRLMAYSRPEALSRLRDAIYIANRYLPPSTLRAAITKDVAPRISNYEKKSQLNCPELGQVLLQLAMFLMDHEHLGSLTTDLIFNPSVKSTQDSPTAPAAVKAQSLRHVALFRWLTGGRSADAEDRIKESIKVDGNERSARIALCNIHRSQGCYDSAWPAISPFYEATRKMLLASGQDPLNLPSNLIHHFICLMRGAICRSIAKEKYPKSELDEDLVMMNRLLSIAGPFPVETFRYQPDHGLLPRQLSIIWGQCQGTTLARLDVDAINDLRSLLIK